MGLSNHNAFPSLEAQIGPAAVWELALTVIKSRDPVEVLMALKGPNESLEAQRKCYLTVLYDFRRQGPEVHRIPHLSIVEHAAEYVRHHDVNKNLFVSTDWMERQLDLCGSRHYLTYIKPGMHYCTLIKLGEIAGDYPAISDQYSFLGERYEQWDQEIAKSQPQETHA